ncbi:hypothetical protein [Gracilimonas sp.]|uniref:hypothetical protein n=1 Tax=Gracilimonas sp. TaxID=1974203 RepID=UPI0028720FA4|nr:hypothetical protein [Gracilimonas sp.]
MKNYFKILALLITTIFLFIGIACQQQQPSEMGHMDSDEQYLDAVPLIYHMSFMQRYATKLYFSGMAENWELADIYAHEIEELSETIIDGNHMDDGIDVSGLLESMLPPQIELIEEAIDAQDRQRFESNYQTMIQTCNQCHQAANYGAVKITVPTSNPFAQDFSLPEKE